MNRKTVLLGVSGGIAAYKSAGLCSMLVKSGYQVHVIMTKNAVQFISPVTFEALSGNRCVVDTFDRNFEFHVEHVALAKAADVLILAPATANVIGKIAGGIADDMLTTTVMACKCKKIIVPAMNTRMYENPILQRNLETLRSFGMEVVEPAIGYLACGDTGAGKMPEPETLFHYVERELVWPRDLEGKKILVTAGPTREAIDPVRFITNHSTGKMGYALAKRAALRGARVTLVTGPTDLTPPMFVEVVETESAEQMFEEVTALSGEMDAVIKAAAVADYRPKHVGKEKTKKTDGEMAVELERTRDILSYLGTVRREGQLLCGFSMETEHMLENSRAKLKKKHVDMIVANNLRTDGAGFGAETNVVTIITADREIPLDKMSKEEVADRVLTELFFPGPPNKET